MSDFDDGATLLRYFQLRLMTLLPQHADLAAQLDQPDLPNLALLGALNGYAPQAIHKQMVTHLRYRNGSNNYMRDGYSGARNHAKSLFWMEEFYTHKPGRYFLLQAPIELVPQNSLSSDATRELEEAIGGSGYHDYDTGRIPQEYQLVHPAAIRIVRLLLVMQLDEPWWDTDTLVLTRADIDYLAGCLARMIGTESP